MTPTHVVIVDAVRTPTGKYLGGLCPLSAPQLGAHAIRALLQRNGLTGDDVDEVMLGNVIGAGLGQAPARQAALGAGISTRVAAVAFNQVCGASLRAVIGAAQAIRCGDASIVVAGGMESMSNAPHLIRGMRQGIKAGDQPMADAMIHEGLWCAFEGQHMGLAAEYTAKKSGITRRMQDEFALRSHQRAIAAWEAGAFAREVVPIQGPNGPIERDETFRPDTSLEKLAALKPAFHPRGSVTAGNAPGLNDAASALLIASAEAAKARGWKPLARIAGYAVVGTQPLDLFYAPIHSTRRLLDKLKMKMDNFDLVEVNEAFAAQTLADGKELDWDWGRVNVHGGAIALGHPLGASGGRILTTLLWALHRHDVEWGLATICMGGGLGLSLAVQRS